MIRDAKTNKIIEIILWCIRCKAYTTHKLEDDHVKCRCGSEVPYESEEK